MFHKHVLFKAKTCIYIDWLCGMEIHCLRLSNDSISRSYHHKLLFTKKYHANMMETIDSD